MNLVEAKAQVVAAFEAALNISTSEATGLIPAKLTAGKIYEAHILALICESLFIMEGCTLSLQSGTKLVLKSSHGPINRSYPWIAVERKGELIAEIFTDIEFLSMSYGNDSESYSIDSPKPITQGDFHELDIALITPGASARPRHDQVLVAVECKNTAFHKGLLKEVLGVRRELSLLLADPTKTIFRNWPSADVPAKPPSCLLVYSTSAEILNFSSPGKLYGITFEHEQL